MSIPFHKIWVEQCEATEDIREHFGLENALGYLIGEKLFTFLFVSERDPTVAAEIPAFVEQIRRLFTPAEIRDYLDRLEHSKFLASTHLDNEIDDLDDDTDEDPWPDNPIYRRRRTAPLFTHSPAFADIGSGRIQALLLYAALPKAHRTNEVTHALDEFDTRIALPVATTCSSRQNLLMPS
jgi:hypothetical protein